MDPNAFAPVGPDLPSAAVSRGPSWIDWLVQRVDDLPGPSWWVYLVALLVYAALGNIVYWFEGDGTAGTIVLIRSLDGFFSMLLLPILPWLATRMLGRIV